MAIEQIKKRNGKLVTFERDKINTAITKAFHTSKTKVDDTFINNLTGEIVEQLDNTYTNSTPSVENVQDIVEKKIAEHGFFDIAKAYIIYRQEHQEQREEKQEEIVEQMKGQKLSVKKRDGSVVPFDVNEITQAVFNCCGYLKNDIDINDIIHSAARNVYDGITTHEINQAIIMAMRSRIERDPEYSRVAARFLLNDLYKDVLGKDQFEPGFVKDHQASFANSIKKGVEAGRLDKRLLEFDLTKLSQKLSPQRDSLFTYLGAQILYDRYFLRDLNQNHMETPQYFWMRVAMGLSINEKNRESRAVEFYNAMSLLRYVPSTPTLFHAGTTHPQMSSCYLTTVNDDLSHIFKSIGDNAQLSKWSGGLGNDWTNIRATGAKIKSTNVGSQGVIPFLKIVDTTTAAINRSGKRRGATCVYLETWHLDIEDFIQLRKNTGDERRRTHDTNTANWIPDLFMKRVINDQDWTLFSPDDTPDLHDLYGQAFEKQYENYERQAKEGKITTFKTIKAKDLWRKMIVMLFETGHPWITFKDPSNIRSPQDHVGTVHSSNLCTEITLNTSDRETAVCNLGSLNLPRFITGKKINKELLEKTISTAMRMLDNVIDLNYYPTPEARNSNLQHRPIGLGLMGLQDALYELGLNFDSEEAVEFSDETMEFISYHAILGSSKLAEEYGPYATFKGSKWDRGLFPLDTLGMLEKERGIPTKISKSSKLKWDKVKKRVAKHGMRNSNCLAIAPTATIANISGSIPSIEPIYKNIYVKSNFSGEFTVINHHLVKELKKKKLWSKELLAQIKQNDGNIQQIKEIPQRLKDKYKEVFEIDPIWILRHAAHRGKWIDQSQSINIFNSGTSGSKIANLYIAAWRMGLKTTYYLRSLSASTIEKSTLEVTSQQSQTQDAATKKQQPVPAMVVAKKHIHIAEDAICEACE